MDLISILATVILITTLGTLIIAVAAYAAFKLRDKRKPQKKNDSIQKDGPFMPVFLTPYVPSGALALMTDKARTEKKELG